MARRADEAKVQELCAMGFPEQQVRDALVRWDNDTNQAASYLLDSGNQLVPVAGLCGGWGGPVKPSLANSAADLHPLADYFPKSLSPRVKMLSTGRG